ncbi:ATP-binding cassette domain-containing protein [Nocardia sp. NBC_00511]|uniref:ATP-binding cassette domain-containing protein n=1 Tax=Nocardia sp. NBC_00511 TaxID=2903591 RepID=UPI0030DF838F
MTSRALHRFLGLLDRRAVLRLCAVSLCACVAALAGVGLLGLSGWFLAACALSGAGVLPGFNYYLPSGGVRALALTRIGARYGERLGAHACALDWLARIRLRLFDDLAEAPASVQREATHSDALDRVMNDAESLDNALVGVVIPLCAIGATFLAGVSVLAWMFVPAAIGCAIGASAAALAMVVRMRTRRTLSTELADARGAARVRITMVASAAPELVCLGAAPQLQRELRSQLTRIERIEARAAVRDARALLAMRVLGMGVVALVLFSLHTGTSTLVLPTATMVTLLTVLLMEQLEAVVGITRQCAESCSAAERLTMLRTSARYQPTPRLLDLPFEPGTTTIVSGPSGIGKTTALRALATTPLPPRALVPVWHDDPLFTGSVAENLRMAAPELTDTELRQLLDDFGLSALTAETMLGAGAHTLSHGETRRFTIARAVAGNPRVLILDEPTEGLDPAQIRDTFEAIRRRLPHATLVAAVHDRHHRHLPTSDIRHVRLD